MRYLRGMLVILAAAIGTVYVAATSSISSPEEWKIAHVAADLEPFRSAFNEASKHVRAVLLVGPT